MAPPSWAPTKEQVASYVPGRTLVGAQDGYGNALSTFDTTTHPTGVQVLLLIADACAWVTVKAGAIHESLTDAASACAAVRTAGQVEQGYPDNTSDANLAALLFTQASQMRDDLARRNEVLTGVDVEDPAAHLMPVYSFPPPVPWDGLNL